MLEKTKTTPNVLSATTMLGDTVVNITGDELGTLEELMIDLNNGRVSYAVLSFGGFLGVGNKLFAVPWDALTLDPVHERLVLEMDVDEEMLENAPGFEHDDWPESVEETWLRSIYTHYDYEPYW